jgi:hypothetical protein
MILRRSDNSFSISTKGTKKSGTKVQRQLLSAGKALAKLMRKQKGIDDGWFLIVMASEYAGRIKAFADAAREGRT